MDNDDVKHAMGSVMDSMGRAAREGRSRRFTKRPGTAKIDIGEVTLEPTMKTSGVKADVEVDPLKEAGMTPEELDELTEQLSLQR